MSWYHYSKSYDLPMQNILTELQHMRILLNQEGQSYFSLIVKYGWVILIIYLIIIIGLVLWLRYSQHIFHTLTTAFRVSIDNLYYTTSLLLYTNKDNIHDFKENIPLLLQYKTNLINKKSQANYYENIDDIIKEVEYIYLLTESQATITDKEQLLAQWQLLQHLSHTINTLKQTLTFLTLGLFQLFL